MLGEGRLHELFVSLLYYGWIAIVFGSRLRFLLSGKQLDSLRSKQQGTPNAETKQMCTEKIPQA
jgi:hypothetical protein